MNVRQDVRAASGARSMGLVLVMAAHAALAWLLLQGLGLRISLKTPAPPILASVIEEHRPETPLRPVQPDVLPSQDPVLREPDIPLDVDDTPPPVDLSPPRGDTVANDPGSGIGGPRREGVAVDPRHPLTQPPYPAASVRFGEEGTVTLELRVARDGRVLAARVLQSSGFPRLDAAALEEARRVWRLRPASEGGTAIEAEYSVRVSFRLDRR